MLVALSVALRKEVVDGLDLSFKPAMLDGGNFVFALDCLKSFLGLIAPQSHNGDDLRDLAAAIEAMMATQSISAWNESRRQPAPIGDDAQAALAVLQGNSDAADIARGGILVSFASRSTPDEPTPNRSLSISVHRNVPLAAAPPSPA